MTVLSFGWACMISRLLTLNCRMCVMEDVHVLLICNITILRLKPTSLLSQCESL